MNYLIKVILKFFFIIYNKVDQNQ